MLRYRVGARKECNKNEDVSGIPAWREQASSIVSIGSKVFHIQLHQSVLVGWLLIDPLLSLKKELFVASLMISFLVTLKGSDCSDS